MTGASDGYFAFLIWVPAKAGKWESDFAEQNQEEQTIAEKCVRVNGQKKGKREQRHKEEQNENEKKHSA